MFWPELKVEFSVTTLMWKCSTAANTVTVWSSWHVKQTYANPRTRLIESYPTFACIAQNRISASFWNLKFEIWCNISPTIELTFRHIRTLQQENKELRAALEEHQNALELIMSKYRQHVTRYEFSSFLHRQLLLLLQTFYCSITITITITNFHESLLQPTPPGWSMLPIQTSRTSTIWKSRWLDHLLQGKCHM